jgi:two-component system LytT family response regulator
MDTSNPPIRAVIVENQDPPNLGIRSLLNRYADIDVVGEYRAERDGLEAIRTHSPELVFLDVPRTGPLGLDPLGSVGLRLRPYFIFVTPQDVVRRQALPITAVDYLSKPFDESRFDEVLTRARAALSHVRYTAMPAARHSAAPPPPTPQVLDRIAVKSRGQLLVLRVREIEWVKAGQDYVELHVGSKYWLLRETIGTLETQLAPSGFVRIHRSTLVNIDRVRELRPLSKGEFMVVLLDGTELKLSRNYRKALKAIAGYGFT